MDGNDARLSIDFWHTSVRAVLRRANGRVSAVMLDGDTSMTTGVAVGEDATLHTGAAGALIGAAHPQLYVRLPGQHLFDERIRVGPAAVDPVDLVAAILTRVAHQADVAAGGALGADVVICTPAWWVPRQQERLRAAARRAGLANPRVLDTAEAIIRDQMAGGARLPVGAAVVVCRLDATVGEVVVVCRRLDGLERLATHPLGEVGETPGATMVEQAANALTQALGSAGIRGEQVSAVFCHAPETAMAALTDALPAAAGRAVLPVQVADLAAASGGLLTTLPNRPVKSRGHYARLFHSLAGVAAGGFGAGFLAYQVFSSSEVYQATSTNPKTLITQWCAWGLASVFALLALVAAGLAVADLRAIRHPTTANPDRPDAKLGSFLLFAAALGVGLAAVFALVGGASFEFDPLPMLAWTLGSTAPTAAVVGALALLCSRASVRGGWRERLRLPVEALAVAAASTVAVVASYTGVPFHDRTLWWTMEHVGAFGIGYAMAWLVTRRLARLLIVGTLLGVAGMVAISIDTFNLIGVLLIGALTAWWLVRLVQLGSPMLSELNSARVGLAAGLAEGHGGSGPPGAGEPG